MFGLTTTKKALQAFAPYIKALQQIAVTQTLSGNLLVYGYNNSGDQLNAYATIDDLYSIVRKIDKTCKRIPFYEYVVKDEKSFGIYRIEQRKAQQGGYSNKHLANLQELHYKSLEIVGETGQIQKILDKPNDFQSKDEFYEAAYGFILLSGNNYIRLNVLPEGGNAGKLYEKNAMWHLPPNYTFPVPTDTAPRKTAGYKFTMYGVMEDIPLDQIIHRKYFNPVYDYAGRELVGLSPLQSAQKTLTQIGNERDYANRSLINAGAGGVLVGDAPDGFADEVAGQMKDDVLRELGPAWQNKSNINANKLALIFGKWNYLKTAIDPEDMQLIEQGKVTFKKLCNVYGISDRLFNNDATGSEISVDKMVREMYTNVVLPEVCSLRDSFNMSITPRYNDGRQKRVIDYDISDITELQEDMTNVVTRFASAPAFRVNDLYEALGWGRLDDPAADVVLVKQGYGPLEDITTPVNVDLTGVNDYAGNS